MAIIILKEKQGAIMPGHQGYNTLERFLVRLLISTAIPISGVHDGVKYKMMEYTIISLVSN